MLRKDFERKITIKATDLVTDTMLKKQYEDIYEPFFEAVNHGQLSSDLTKVARVLLLKEKADVAKIVSSCLTGDNAQAQLKAALSEQMMVLAKKAVIILEQINEQMMVQPLDIKQMLRLDLERKVINYMINDINGIIPSAEDQDAIQLTKDVLSKDNQQDPQTRSLLYRESLTRNRSHKRNTERMIKLLKESGGGVKNRQERKSTFEASVNTYKSARKYSNERISFFKDPSAKLLEQLKASVADYAKVYVTHRFSEERLTGSRKPQR